RGDLPPFLRHYPVFSLSRFCAIPTFPMKTILLLILFAASSELRADDCLPLKVRNPEGNYIVPGVMGDIIYRRINGTEIALDAYVQKRGDRRPSVVVIHGGGWDSGSRIAFVGQFLEILTHAGYNWFSIDYRLNRDKKYNDALDDLRSALAFIRCHAKEFRIDPDRIALFGEDTGAHLASMVAAERPAGVKAAVLIGGLYDLRDTSSPESNISKLTSQNQKGLPPALIVHGTADREMPPAQARQVCEAIREAGRRCDYFPVDGAIHRAENWLPTQWRYKEAVITWLARELDHIKPDHDPYVTNLRKDIVYSPQHKLKFDAYIPKGRGPFPAVIIAHGGGWEAGDKVTYVTPLFEPLARAGFAWFSIDYRLTPQFRHQDQLVDLREAIRFVGDNAKKFRVDPGRIAIVGESASGQMVAQIAPEKPSAITAVVSFYGVYNFQDLTNDTSPRSIPARLFGITTLDDDARAVLRRYSPIYNVRAEMPPILLIHGTNERLWAQGVAMAKKLTESHAAYDFFEIKNAPHGMENWEGHPEWLSYKVKLVEWLKKYLVLQR
ncbi:MAG: alpha/beta hydrolase, partial [Acidobacteria bacterium]|nr:alpha/beta hydrolase [Acidobacteriota bacterium]